MVLELSPVRRQAGELLVLDTPLITAAAHEEPKRLAAAIFRPRSFPPVALQPLQGLPRPSPRLSPRPSWPRPCWGPLLGPSESTRTSDVMIRRRSRKHVTHTCVPYVYELIQCPAQSPPGDQPAQPAQPLEELVEAVKLRVQEDKDPPPHLCNLSYAIFQRLLSDKHLSACLSTFCLGATVCLWEDKLHFREAKLCLPETKSCFAEVNLCINPQHFAQFCFLEGTNALRRYPCAPHFQQAGVQKAVGLPHETSNTCCVL